MWLHHQLTDRYRTSNIAKQYHSEAKEGEGGVGHLYLLRGHTVLVHSARYTHCHQ